MTHSPDRILLVSANGLGDCVAFLPVAAAVRKNRPESRITMMTRRAGAEATQLTGTVNEFILLRRRWEVEFFARWRKCCYFTFAKSWDEVLARTKECWSFDRTLPASIGNSFACACEFFQTARALRKEPFDLAFMASGESSATAALLFLGGVRTRVGFDDCRLRQLLSVRVAAHEAELESRRNTRLLPAAGMPEKLERPPCHIPESLRSEARALLEAAGAKGRPRVLIHPGSSLPSRRWSARNFAEICSRLGRTGLAQPALVVGPAEPGLGDEIRRLAAQPVPVLPQLGRADLLAAVMSECDLFLGHSSGPLQLAFLVGLRSVSLWGDTDPELWGPAWEEDRHVIVRSPLPCAGCERWDPKRHVVLRGPTGSRSARPPCDKCLEAIPVDEVFQAISRQLLR